uniref:Uncharacterized protein n=1 Tax=Micrurus lemniscatus lemniscatus TaxID=129467 RepID=A0A2D4JSR8_MICLE
MIPSQTNLVFPSIHLTLPTVDSKGADATASGGPFCAYECGAWVSMNEWVCVCVHSLPPAGLEGRTTGGTVKKKVHSKQPSLHTITFFFSTLPSVASLKPPEELFRRIL